MGATAGLPIALTMGDPAGIGPEVTIKAWETLRDKPDLTFFVIADPKLYSGAEVIKSPDDAHKVFARALPILPLDCVDIEPRHPNEGAAPAILESIQNAVDHCLNGSASAVVTNPISKDVLYRSGFKHPGHTEFLADLTKHEQPPYAQGPMMMLSAKNLRVALVTIHIALSQVANSLTQEAIIRSAKILHGALKTDFGIGNPRIAMAGLNPHAGENGSIGEEELEILNPAAKNLRELGIDITDAQSADTLFHEEARENYDAALCMYHDQALIPVKALDFDQGVNVTLGLPIIRTSPDHGTAFDIAGKNIANPGAMIAAITMAAECATMRAAAHG